MTAGATQGFLTVFLLSSEHETHSPGGLGKQDGLLKVRPG